MCPLTYDVFVIGLGVMGSAVARACARAGITVAGADSRLPPHEQGSSHGESRIIRAAYFEDPVYTPLALRSFGLWRELEQETHRALLRVTGGLNIGPREGMLVHGALESAREYNLNYELLSSADTMRRWPGLRLRNNDVALFEPDAGILDPEQCIATLLSSARAAGAELHTDVRVSGWQREHDEFEVNTARGTFRARNLVLAVGSWLTHWRPELPLTVARQPVFWFQPNQPQLYAPDKLPHYLIEFEPGRVLYGFPDLGSGVKCALHHEGRSTDPDLVDRTVGEDEIDEVRALASEFLPGAPGPLQRTSVCLYTNTPDGHFLIDRDPDESNLWLLSACSGHGFKFAPAIGALMAAAIRGDGITLPDVFSLRRETLRTGSSG